MYLTTEEAANAAMSHILNGKVGFDTEYTKRRPTDEEALIEETFPNGGASRKSAMLGWQIVELRAGAFTINWDKIGLRLIQIAHNDEVFVLDMWKIRAFPTELVRILSDPNIKKAGVALTNELTVFWDDFRFELVNLVDVGLMAKLVLCEKYQNTSYSNLSLKVSVEEILGYTITKDLQKSDWTKDNLDRDQIIYAATDAVASLLLHDHRDGDQRQRDWHQGAPGMVHVQHQIWRASQNQIVIHGIRGAVETVGLHLKPGATKLTVQAPAPLVAIREKNVTYTRIPKFDHKICYAPEFEPNFHPQIWGQYTVYWENTG
ncbi:ribonuclease H-like domain-containing protein [Mycena maculata]|uniref:3'-5' exonuclease n=1 Tax=Mycena maculata TaxID=230809 RepID=A0AAD7JAL8_9AGAR|nr:ribonuclease H-like domain-containing protein [Mycena maculata]